MSARFRDDYTERRQQEHGGIGGGPVKVQTVDLSDLTLEQRAILSVALAKAGVKQTDEDV